MSTEQEKTKKQLEKDKQEKDEREAIAAMTKMSSMPSSEEEMELDDLSEKSKKEEKKEEKKVDTKSVTMASQANKDDENWLEIIKAFKKEFGEDNIDKEDGALKFPTPEKAIEFFTKQAKEGTEFLVREVTGKPHERIPTGKYAFSCGTGEMYKGSLNDIREKLKSDAEKARFNDPKAADKLEKGLQKFDKFILEETARVKKAQETKNDTKVEPIANEEKKTTPQTGM